MADLNTITLIGRVGKEPEYKAFETGAMLTKFSLSNNQYNLKTKENDTYWFNIETFSKLGEYVKKGNLVAINGKLKQSTWKDEGGNNKSRVYVFAENIQILTPKKDEKVEENNGEIVQFSDESIPF
jgi:single-strand DNA-binding protein